MAVADDRAIAGADELRIRAFASEEVAILWKRATALAAEAGLELSRRSRDTLRRRVARSGAFYRGYLYLAVDESGRLIGSIDVRSGSPMPNGVAEIGIEIFDAANHGAV